MKHDELTKRIIKVYYQVYNELGYGFLERVYQNAMFVALKQEELEVVAQKKIDVWFRGYKVGEYFADLVVEGLVIIELKAADYLVEENEAQLLNYLRGTNIEVGLLFNFGKKADFKRKVYDNNLKFIPI
ncbi:GxxExxY protein [Lacihabitans sp. CCS-44]|uniref:GxxExxY protein n=1 Tax=Lacihabitans sp. CCS-44 TaxID=2487331 RepID=UPI0020CE1428|nr:GxxExxY protein [Lacihabitans sp. CCS-44]MCP9754670.1 GxxExxY protein [Lacihabitans sp. CCS-44]